MHHFGMKCFHIPKVLWLARLMLTGRSDDTSAPRTLQTIAARFLDTSYL